MSVPIRSAGSRSGVNWMRLNLQWIAAASALMAVVLARPGTPSSKTCPPVRSAIKSRESITSWPIRALRTSVLTRSSWSEY